MKGLEQLNQEAKETSLRGKKNIATVITIFKILRIPISE